MVGHVCQELNNRDSRNNK